ncbi:hypothetical protein ABH908_000200 [Pseudomonas frederiksbergensis]|uniref:DUF3085 domain-containing protein n=1 Tax=Pseudomonas TaxID=286 RepID=UPI003D23CBB7
MKTQKIELSRVQVQQLVDHCEKHNLKQWFIAKNQGAYVGALAGPAEEQKWIFFFKGCDPQKDQDWYDTARAKFGGDDFSEMQDIESLKSTLADTTMTAIEVVVTTRQIKIIMIS